MFIEVHKNATLFYVAYITRIPQEVDTLCCLFGQVTKCCKLNTQLTSASRCTSPVLLISHICKVVKISPRNLVGGGGAVVLDKQLPQGWL